MVGKKFAIKIIVDDYSGASSVWNDLSGPFTVIGDSAVWHTTFLLRVSNCVHLSAYCDLHSSYKPSELSLWLGPMRWWQHYEVRNIIAIVSIIALLIVYFTFIYMPNGGIAGHVLVLTGDGTRSCGIFDRTFAVYSSLVSFFIPLVVMLVADARSIQTLRRNFRFSEATGIGADSRHRCTTESDESRPWLSRRRQRQCTRDNDEDLDSSCSDAGAAVMAETNVDRSPSADAFGRSAEHPTPTRPELGQLMPEGRRVRRPLSAGSASALELPDTTVVCGDMESSLSGDLSPVRRSRFNVDDVTSPSVPRRVNVASRRQRQSRSTQACSPGSDRLHNRSVVYINMLTVSGRASPGRAGAGRIGSGVGMKINSRERRAERTLIWVFLAFVVLWLPFFCANLTYGLCRSCQVPPSLFAVFTWLGYLSSGVNPCIYTYLNSDFRKAFRNILACRRLGSRSSRFAREYSWVFCLNCIIRRGTTSSCSWHALYVVVVIITLPQLR